MYDKEGLIKAQYEGAFIKSEQPEGDRSPPACHIIDVTKPVLGTWWITDIPQLNRDTAEYRCLGRASNIGSDTTRGIGAT